MQYGKVMAQCPGCGEVWECIVSIDEGCTAAQMLNGCPNCLRYLHGQRNHPPEPA